MRAIPEWVGKTDDSVPPARVKERVFLKWEGKCHVSGRKIYPADKWDVDHIKPLWLGGENRESNLAPILRDKHREKTAQEATVRAKGSRARQKYLGIKERRAWPLAKRFKRKIDGTVERR